MIFELGISLGVEGNSSYFISENDPIVVGRAGALLLNGSMQ